MESSKAQTKRREPQKSKFKFLLPLTGRIEIRELGFPRHRQRLLSVHLVVQLVRFGKVFLGLLCQLFLCVNPVQKFVALLPVFFLRGFVIFESSVVALLFFLCGVAACCLIDGVSTDESRRVQNGSTNHYRNACHDVYLL